MPGPGKRPCAPVSLPGAHSSTGTHIHRLPPVARHCRSFGAIPLDASLALVQYIEPVAGSVRCDTLHARQPLHPPCRAASVAGWAVQEKEVSLDLISGPKNAG